MNRLQGNIELKHPLVQVEGFLAQDVGPGAPLLVEVSYGCGVVALHLDHLVAKVQLKSLHC